METRSYSADRTVRPTSSAFPDRPARRSSSQPITSGPSPYSATQRSAPPASSSMKRSAPSASSSFTSSPTSRSRTASSPSSPVPAAARRPPAPADEPFGDGLQPELAGHGRGRLEQAGLLLDPPTVVVQQARR